MRHFLFPVVFITWYGCSCFSSIGIAQSVTSASGPSSSWAAAVSGSWSTASNWTAGVPNGIGASATINVPTLTNVEVIIDSSQTVGLLSLGNSASTAGYLLDGPISNSLTFDNAGSGVTINVANGAHQVNVAMVLNDNLTVSGGGTLGIGSANISNGANGARELLVPVAAA